MGELILAIFVAVIIFWVWKKSRIERDAEAQSAQGEEVNYTRGFMYEHGLTYPQDSQEAFNRGVMYEHGLTYPQDYQEACKYYQLAAEQGHASAQYSLGAMYEHGRGVAQDSQKACKYYQLAAEQGHVNAQYSLGVMYEHGRGIPQDSQKACKYYQLAAEIKPRPWVRFFARKADYYFPFFVCLFYIRTGVFETLDLSSIHPNHILMAFFFLLGWPWLIEPWVLSRYGTTPGKWLLRTTVQKKTGGNLSYSEAWKRGTSVWLRGLGMYLPVVSLLTMLAAAITLKNKKETSWDRDGGFVVRHSTLGIVRTIIVVGTNIAFWWWVGYQANLF